MAYPRAIAPDIILDAINDPSVDLSQSNATEDGSDIYLGSRYVHSAR